MQMRPMRRGSHLRATDMNIIERLVLSLFFRHIRGGPGIKVVKDGRGIGIELDLQSIGRFVNTWGLDFQELDDAGCPYEPVWVRREVWVMRQRRMTPKTHVEPEPPE